MLSSKLSPKREKGKKQNEQKTGPSNSVIISAVTKKRKEKEVKKPLVNKDNVVLVCYQVTWKYLERIRLHVVWQMRDCFSIFHDYLYVQILHWTYFMTNNKIPFFMFHDFSLTIFIFQSLWEPWYFSMVLAPSLKPSPSPALPLLP